MPGISNRRKKLKESVSKVQELKRAARNVTTAESNLNVVEPAKVDGRTKLKPGRKKAKKEEISCAVTRRIASVFKLEEKEKEKARERTINASEKLAELQKNVKKAAKKRRKINEKINMNIKIKKIEERTTELEEAIASANSDEPSTSSNDLLSNDTEDVMTFKTTVDAPTLPRPESEAPKIDVHESTRMKNTLGLSERKYGELRNELAKKGIKMSSTSTIKRNENKIFDEHFRHSNQPNFYGMLEEGIMKHDFTKLENVRITIGGDGGGDGEKSSVKVGFFFNDVKLPLSVKKFIIIWSYVGKESWQLLKPVLECIDADVLRLKRDGIMTSSGLKPVIITYVGDIKFQCSSLSLQGGSSVCGCPKCVSKRSEWPTIKSEDIVLRTIDTILADAEQVIHNNCQPRTHGSVFNYPLLRNIEITHFVPPPVHILISLVTVIIEWIRKIKSNNYTPLEEFLSKTGAKLHFPAKTYNGNECRKILSHFRQGNPKRILYDGYGKELFEAAANIELFSVARPLLNDEIQSLESFINLIFNLVKDYGQDALKFFLNKTKIHMLKEHVVPFVRMFGSWGIFSEQSVESIHHIRNVLDDRVPGAGPDIGLKRNNLFLKNQVVALRYC